MRCNVCGGVLTVHEEVRGGCCAQPACRHTALMREIQRREELEAALLAQRIAEVKAGVVASLGLTPCRVAVAVVPASERRLVGLPRKRRAAFRRHLAGVIAESIQVEADAAAPAPGEDELPAASHFIEETRAVRDGCATCRGYCCRLGAGNNAFLDVPTLRRYRALNPDLRPRRILDEYMSRIPETSAENSCVYHGASGCTLPRQMRAAICNVYHCGGLDRMQAPLADPGISTILIVAATESAVVRSTVHDKVAGGERLVAGCKSGV